VEAGHSASPGAFKTYDNLWEGRQVIINEWGEAGLVTEQVKWLRFPPNNEQVGRVLGRSQQDESCSRAKARLI
jgi:hypothetical protein